MTEKQVVTKKGVSVTIYPTPQKGTESYTLVYYLPGKKGVRERERVTGREEAAVLRAEQIINQIAGGSHAISERHFSAKELGVFSNVDEILADIRVELTTAVVQFRDAFRILDGRGSIVQAAMFYAENLRKAALKPKMFPDVVSEFLTDIQNRKLSPHYIRTTKFRLNAAKKVFNMPIAEISRGEINKWFKNFQGRNYKNYRDGLITLFNFAKKQGYLLRGEETEAELTAEAGKSVAEEVTILSPENFEKLLNLTPTRYLPLVAIGGFAGVRTAEIYRLDWKDVDFEQGFITIQAKNAKTASRRLVPICKALKAWLKNIAKPSGPIMPGFKDDQRMMKQWFDVNRRFKNEDGTPFILSANILRHCYGTYRLAEVQDTRKVSLEMGNSPQMLFQNYRNLATPELAKRFFGILPKKKRVSEYYSKPSDIKHKLNKPESFAV